MKPTFVFRFRSAPNGAFYRGAFACAALALLGIFAIFFLRTSKPAPAPRFSLHQAARVSFSSANQKPAKNLSALAWRFEPNVGQSDRRVKFLARARNASIFLTKQSIYFSWAAPQAPHGQLATEPQDSLQVEFAGSASLALPIGERELPGETNYLIGRNSADWHTNIPNYAAVRYPALYHGVSARIYGGSEGLEYDLTAKSACDVREISLQIKGATIHLDDGGNLEMHSAAHAVLMRRPTVYQIINGKRTVISGAYKITARNKVAFVIGKHQRGAAILIDPIISVAYTTFLGGAGAEKGNSVAVDSAGAVYVGGTTTLPSFPGDASTLTDGPATGNPVLFAAKIDPTQTGAASLLYLTFIGGSGTEQGGMVAVDNSVAPPALAIAGWTTSADFPVFNSTSALNGPSDLTITELNGTGTGVLYSEYFGGSGAEATQNFAGIATDSAGDVFVTSDTTSTDLLMTATTMNSIYGGGASDGFIAEFAPGSSSTPGSLIYSTYLGITATVGSTSVAVDGSGHIYVGGFTSAPSAFPATNAFQSNYGGGPFDGFVMEINPAVSGPAGVIYASLLGGSQSDQIFSIALDNASPPDVYLAGATQSPDLIPSSGVTNAPFQSALAGSTNGFFAVVNQSTGSPVLQYLTYLGGSSSDSAQSVAVVSPTQVYIAGTATSANFPVMCSLQGFTGTQDAFVSEFNPSVAGSSSLIATTLLGGTVTVEANSVAVESSGNAIVFGDTLSPDYPLAGDPNNGFQPTCASCGATPALSDAFLTEVNANTNPSGCVAFNPSPGNIGTFADGTSSPPLNILLTNVGNASLNITGVTVTGANSTDFSQTNTCLTNSPIAPAGTCDLSVTFSPTIIGPETATLQVTDDGVGSPQILTLNGTGTGVGVTLAPTSLSFPNTAQGQTNTLTATLTNTGNDTLTITGQQQQIQGTNAQDFAFLSSSTCTSAATPTFAPGTSCAVDVQFAPIETSPPQSLSAQAIVSLTDSTNQATQTISIPLSGTEVAATPGILFAPPSLAFSSQNVGTSTAAQAITVTNNGSAALAISGISITGANPSDFSETNSCPLAPNATLAINANCSIAVVFQPTATGPRSAAVSVADNASGSPQTVSLSGTGTAAGVSLTPSSLTFAGLNPGSGPSAPQTVTLQNTGTGPLTISKVAITGADPSDFGISGNNCPVGPAATLNPGNSCVINVTFNPTATGQRSASLSVSDDATPSPQIVGLTGTGTSPAISFSTGNLQFGNTLLKAQSASQAIHVKNPGNGPLVIAGVTTIGINPGDFQVSGGCVGVGGASVSVPAGGTCDVDVTFVPTVVGSRSAGLSVADNAPASPQQQVLMSGTGVDFQLTPIAGGSTSASISAGETATFNMQASPQGFSGAAQLSCTNPIPAATCTVTPAQVNISPNQPTAFAVNITTTARAVAPLWQPILRHGPPPLPLFALLGISFMLIALARCRSRWPKLVPVFILLVGFLLASCGSSSGNSSSNGTPAGNYTVTITASVPGASRAVNLSVTVQ